ncbi:hypothetical protein [Bacillus salipaludis]|uniref:Glycosyltransferase n=1 Tax=Bacillus salipaludis TaxID=2547811 RepID=A0ABW8R9Z3_9BACI
MSVKIQQQLYTRERGGIFHATDGYDTIAISEGLDQGFVKKYLHPFCMYQSPKTLAERGEKDASLYPEAVTMFQPETGELAIGQAVFVPADFTGSRSTYFMHNYIIPGARKDEWIKHPEKLFQMNDFQTSYNLVSGKVLPEREAVEYKDSDILTIKSDLLRALRITEENFKQLLFAVMSSIAGKKKVFISLNVPIQDYTNYALKLLELLYLYLPYAHRRRLGAMTFTSEPESKNYIHVTFYEPGTLNIGDRAIEKQYIFNFAGNKIYGVDLAGQQHEYLDLALHHFHHSERMDDFFEFAEMALAGLPDAQRLDVASYYQLTDMYLAIRYNDLSLYEKNKAGFLNSLLKFLQVNSDEKPDLTGLFLELLRQEKVAADKATALDYLHAVVSINAFVRSDEALFFILETLMYYQNDPLFKQLWKTIEQDLAAHEALVMFMNEHADYEDLFELYLNERFKPLVLLEDLLNELKAIAGTPYLIGIEKFKSVVRIKIAAAISSEGNPFKAVMTVKNFRLDRPSAAFDELKQELLAHAKLSLLRSIRLQNLTLPDITAFGDIFTKELNVKDMKDVKAKENYLITNALYELISYPSQAGLVNLKSLTVAAREQLREILLRLLRNNPLPEQFPLLLTIFETEFDGVDYQGVLDYLIKYSDDKTLLSFIRGNARLVEIDFGYRRSLRKYLIGHPRSIWKNKTLRKELQFIKNYSFQKLLKEVETETASPVVKFFKKNGLKLGLALVILGGGTWFTLDLVFGGDTPAPKTEKTAAGARHDKTTPNEDKKEGSVVSLERFTKADPEKAGQAAILNLNSKHVKSIIGQAQGAALTDINGHVFQIDFIPQSGAVPFDQNGVLKMGYTLYGTEYDFDAMDDSFEVVLFAKAIQPAESYLFVYSLKTNNTIDRLMPILTMNGVSNVKLEDKKLTLQSGDKEIIKEYKKETTTFSDPES